MTPLAWLALTSITLYQRHLSPRKGYCCALHATGRGRSCSAYGYRAIARAGVFNGCTVLRRRRLAACARASVDLIASTPTSSRRYRTGLMHQRGFCDAGCDVGDCGGIDLPGDCAGNSCSGCAPEWPWGRQQAIKPETNLDDHLNNEKALRERIRQTQDRQRREPADDPGQ